MPDRPQKITFAQMRQSGVRGLLIYCTDYRCSHSIAISGDAWPDDMRTIRLRTPVRLHSLRHVRRRCAAEFQPEGEAGRNDGISGMKCARCDGTRWVREAHPERPWEGQCACGCGAAGMELWSTQSSREE
jgi:hypothetical protein